MVMAIFVVLEHSCRGMQCQFRLGLAMVIVMVMVKLMVTVMVKVMAKAW